MKQGKYTAKQIVNILKEADAGIVLYSNRSLTPQQHATSSELV